MANKQSPTPTQICDYLWAHGWRECDRFSTGWMFEFERLSDDGHPITVLAPGIAEYDDYPLRVSDVIDSLAALERRSKDAVRADLLAVNNTSAASPNGAPAVGVADSPAQPLA